MWTLNYNSKEATYKIETDSQTQTTDFGLPRKREGRGGVD